MKKLGFSKHKMKKYGNLNYEREINERIMRELRFEKQINEKLKNDLNAEKLINERMLKSQEDMNQLNQKNEKNLYRQKGKVGLGYNEEEDEYSKQGAKRNQKPTCNHCGKIVHTSNKC